MHPEHDDDAAHQRGERGVERDAQAHGDAGDVATHGALRFLQCGADAAHRADEADGRNGPGREPHHRELGVHARGLEVAFVAHGFRGVLHAARGAEPVVRDHQQARQEAHLLVFRQRFERPRIDARVFRKHHLAFADLDVFTVEQFAGEADVRAWREQYVTMKLK